MSAILLTAVSLVRSSPIDSGPDHEIETIELPPYVIEVDRGPPWKLVHAPDFEVLSRCSDELTLDLINRYERLLAMLALILPPEIDPHTNTKTLLILDDAAFQPPVSQELTTAIDEQLKKRESQVSFMPYLFFQDGSSQVIYAVLEKYITSRDPTTLAPGYLRYLLESHYPALPRWFVEGMVTLQQTTIMPVPPVGRNIIGDEHYGYANPLYPFDEVRITPFVWIDHEQTERMTHEVKTMARTTNHAYLPDSFPITPLRDVLETQNPETLGPEDHSIFPYEAALLIRWALDPRPREYHAGGDHNSRQPTAPDSRAQALWKFVMLSSQQGMSDLLFEQCFGESITAVEKHLRGYLPFACLETSDFKLARDTIPKSPDYAIRDASDREIAIRRGRLNRLAVNHVRTFYPELTEAYQAQARRTLYRTYHQGDRDFVLLAEIGLGEVDIGADVSALPFLQTAADHQSDNPRIYYELARIKFQQLLAQDNNLAPSHSQLEEIENVLTSGLSQSPQLAASYGLLFEIWLRNQDQLTHGQLEYIQQGSRLFHRDFRIIYAAALLQAKQGNLEQARQIATTALKTFKGTVEATKINRLLLAINSSQTK